MSNENNDLETDEEASTFNSCNYIKAIVRLTILRHLQVASLSSNSYNTKLFFVE